MAERIVIRQAEEKDNAEMWNIFYEANVNTVYLFFEEKFGTQRWLLLFIALLLRALYAPTFDVFTRRAIFLVAIATSHIYVPGIFFRLIKVNDRDFRHGLAQFYNNNQPGHRLFVAEINSKVIGMVGVKKATERTNRFAGLTRPADAELTRMAISHTARGMGLGKKLLDEASSYCQKEGYERIILSTGSTNVVAVNYLYPRYGFILERSYDMPFLGGMFSSLFFSKDLTVIIKPGEKSRGSSTSSKSKKQD